LPAFSKSRCANQQKENQTEIIKHIKAAQNSYRKVEQLIAVIVIAGTKHSRSQKTEQDNKTKQKRNEENIRVSEPERETERKG
jgi:hypothetical protein